MKGHFVVFQQWGEAENQNWAIFQSKQLWGNKRDKILRIEHSQNSKCRVLEAQHGGCYQEPEEHPAMLAPALHVWSAPEVL